MKEIGTIKINTHSIMVSDPCYVDGTWCQGVATPVVKGDWRCFVAEEGGRVASLKIVNEAVSPKTQCIDGMGFVVGVASGQAGFWDITAYRNRQLVPEKFRQGDSDQWWHNMCLASISTDGDSTGPFGEWYVGPFGVHCNIGPGIYTYGCYAGRNKQGLIVALELPFTEDRD